jgi:hypothetical protein
MTWILFFFAALIFWMVLFKLTQWVDNKISQALHARREEKFLHFVQIKFPDHKSITSISVAASDKQTLDNIERRLRDYY